MRLKKSALLKWVLGLAIFGLAVKLFLKRFEGYSLKDILESLQAVPLWSIGFALAMVALDSLIIIRCDVMTLRWLGNAIPYRQTALAGFLGNVFGRTIGFPMLTASGVAYRLYRKWDLEPKDIGHLIAFRYVSLWMGFMTAAGLALLFAPIPMSGLAHSDLWFCVAGGFCLALVLGFLFLTKGSLRELRVQRFCFVIPPFDLAVRQITLCMTKWLGDVATLYVLFGPQLALPYISFVVIYFAAQTISVISHVPGGLGVFDVSLMYFLKERLAVPSLVGTLAIYRGIYTLAPLIPALLLYVVWEIRHGIYKFG